MLTVAPPVVRFGTVIIVIYQCKEERNRSNMCTYKYSQNSDPSHAVDSPNKHVSGANSLYY